MSWCYEVAGIGGGTITRPVACPANSTACDPEFKKGPVLYNLVDDIGGTRLARLHCNASRCFSALISIAGYCTFRRNEKPGSQSARAGEDDAGTARMVCFSRGWRYGGATAVDTAVSGKSCGICVLSSWPTVASRRLCHRLWLTYMYIVDG